MGRQEGDCLTMDGPGVTLDVLKMNLHPAKRLFERLSLEIVRGELVGQEFEGQTLDCKEKSNPIRMGLDHDDKKNFAKELCAFANTDGGLVIWGLSARAIGGVDRIQAIVPVSGLDRFESNLRTIQPQLTEPPVPGVELVQIPVDGTGAEKRGMVAIWVPPSNLTLHRSTQDRRFYSRSGTSSWPMPMSLVTPLLAGKSRPQLSLHVDFTSTDRAVICLRNNGNATARDPFFAINLPHPLGDTGYELNGTDHLRSCSSGPAYRGVRGRWLLYNAGADHPIHPGAELRVVAIRPPLGTNASGTEFSLEAFIYADGAPEIHDVVKFPWP